MTSMRQVWRALPRPNPIKGESPVHEHVPTEGKRGYSFSGAGKRSV